MDMYTVKVDWTGPSLHTVESIVTEGNDLRRLLDWCFDSIKGETEKQWVKATIWQYGKVIWQVENETNAT